MPLTEYNNDFIDKRSKKNSCTRFAFLLTVLIVILNLFLFDSRGIQTQITTNPGVYIDSIALAFLFFILSCTNKISINHKSVLYIRYGLIIWICSATFDTMDELVYQPKWAAYFLEDFLKIIGISSVGFGVYTLIKKINNKYVEAQIQSFSDELTQLPNRRFFIRKIEEIEENAPYLFIIDIDNFKVINDQYGHAKGDEVLSKVGRILSHISNQHTVAARIGGEEFAVILQSQSPKQADELAKNILKQINHIIIKNTHILSVSIGAGQKHPHETIKNLIKRADVALYKAKNAGKGRVEWAKEPEEKPTSPISPPL